jgi:hypothetical protein
MVRDAKQSDRLSIGSTWSNQRSSRSNRTPSSQLIEAGGQTMSPGSRINSSCSLSVRPPAPVGADENSSPTTMEEDTDDDLLDYEPSPAHNGMEVNIVYLSSTDYSLLEEEEVSQLALGPQDAIIKKPAESGDHLKSLYIRGHLNGMPVTRMLVLRA